VLVNGARPEREDGPVRVLSLGAALRRPFQWLTDLTLLRLRLRGIVRERQIDVVEVPDYQGLYPAAFDACPLVLRLHLSATTIAREAGRPENRLLRAAERRTLARHGRWIAVSKHSLALTEATFGVAPAASSVIYYPVVEPAPVPVEPIGHPYLVYCGTVNRRKGAYALAEAARDLLRADPDLRLVYVGTGVEEEGGSSIERVKAILGAQASQAVFTGRIARAAAFEYVRHALLAAVPSTLETFGLVAAEAMLAGIPVVAYDCGPFPEFISHGRTGLLVKPEGLRDAIAGLLASPAERQRIGDAARRWIGSEFSLEKCVESSLAFYSACS
jgi:glycosyltransferase involved in cell wall biosynthesis